MLHISVVLWALEVGEGRLLSQFSTGRLVVFLVSRPRSRVLGVKTPVSGSQCLTDGSAHPDYRRKGCDKGLEAVKKRPL
jgi:hypothetical protein